jgi:hypothetical protein
MGVVRADARAQHIRRRVMGLLVGMATEGSGGGGGGGVLSSVTFSGGGFKTISYLGWCCRRYAEGRLGDGTSYYGTSMGAVYAVGAALLLRDGRGFGAFAAMATELVLYCADVAEGWCRHFGTCAARLRRVMEEHWPEDVSRAQGRCHVCLTHFSRWGSPCRQLVSRFRSKADLIAAVSASCFIPFWNVGLARPLQPLTRFRGRLAMDGGVSDNAPVPPVAAADGTNAAADSAGVHETVSDEGAAWHQSLVPPVGRDHGPPEEPEDSPGLRGSLEDIRRGFLDSAAAAAAAPPHARVSLVSLTLTAAAGPPVPCASL